MVQIKKTNTLSVRIRRRLLLMTAKLFPDAMFLRLLFPLKVGYKLDLNNPTTFNEKLQWLKLYDRKPEFVKMVDKYEAKDYVKTKIGEEHVIPTIGVYNTWDEIDIQGLPEKFVIKCTHDSGGILICTDKSGVEWSTARRKIENALKTNYYWRNREWPYKGVKPRIIAEDYMVDESGKELKDYKFFCFDGKVRFYKIDFDRFIEHHSNYYDREGRFLPFGEAALPPVREKELHLPTNFQEMIQIAEKLSKGIPFVRIDLYNVNGRIYFGEITFFPASGMGQFTSYEWDEKIGEMLKLPS